MKSLFAGIVLLYTAILFSAQAHAVEVAVELHLLIDTSNSIDPTEFQTQTMGYAAAFNSPLVISALNSVGSIAVAVSYFSTTATPGPEVDGTPMVGNNPQIGWTLVNAANVSDFVTLLQGLQPTDNEGVDAGSGAGETNIADAIRFGLNGNGVMGNSLGFDNNDFEGDRLVIDISTDGVQNTQLDGSDGTNDCLMTPELCTDIVSAQRDAADALGIRINAIAINPDDIAVDIGQFFPIPDGSPDGFTFEEALMSLGLDADAGIDDYLREFVITNNPGNEGFVTTAEFADAQSFADAIAEKIAREINPIPLPAAFYLFASCILGLMAWSRRKVNSIQEGQL